MLMTFLSVSLVSINVVVLWVNEYTYRLSTPSGRAIVLVFDPNRHHKIPKETPHMVAK